MILLVVGSRSIKAFSLEEHIPPETTLIVTGGANGVDALAERYADKKRLSKLILRPEYSVYGKGAPLKRNEKMVDICDMALIVWDGISNGTKYTIEYAQKCEKKIKVIVENKN